MSSLDSFHPLIQRWFKERVGSPTEVQNLAWPRIASGEHLLVTAPTGSGKTLAAFLCALNELLSGRWAPGRIRVLYVSPLKALNNDVRRNLLSPLEQLTEVFAKEGKIPPPIRVVTRSGDTPSDERQRLGRHPPEILITTPESLNILLTSEKGRGLLTDIRTVILDEVHAVVEGKRGTHLITAIERLVPLAGEFQRIALSATVRPLERVAKWVGGYQLVSPPGEEPRYQPRPVNIVQSKVPKRYELSVHFAPGDEQLALQDDGLWQRMTLHIKGVLDTRRSTLLFANSRRMVEKMARFINEGQPEELVYAHHGSLSREIRAVVEERLKAGQVRGIVATNSLELGIDIGSLDEVLLLQTPRSLSSTIQRIGRAGHGVGQTSEAQFLPLVPRDLVDSAVVAHEVLQGEIEPVRPVMAPLDVLAQLLVSLTATQEWNIDELYAQVRCADPYQELSRRQFDGVLEMLAGRYASSRVRELRPMVHLDRASGRVRARPGSDRLVYMAGGTIPDRGYFHLRRSESNAMLGELDEEFVWERAIGDTFTLGVQTWRIASISHNDVQVVPAHGTGAMAPFWRADEQDRGFMLSEKVSVFLEKVEERLDDPSFKDELARDYYLSPPAITALIDLLQRQKRALEGVLPHRHRLVVEQVAGSSTKSERGLLLMHTMWGGKLNRPYAMALQAAWKERYGTTLEVITDDNCVMISVNRRLSTDELIELVPAEKLDRLLRTRLEQTGFFGARFRQAAGRALLLPRVGFHHRTPLWLSRLRAKKLLEAVSRYDDFPIVLETWRECLQDEFDLPRLRQVLEEIRDGETQVREVFSSAPSPFAAQVTWKQTNELMYEDDEPEHQGPSRTRQDLVRELVFTSKLRPRIARSLIESLERKLQRLEPGWSPRSSDELIDWVAERLVLPESEWEALYQAMLRDHGPEVDQWISQLGTRIAKVSRADAKGGAFVCAVEELPRLMQALELTPKQVRAQTLSPVTPLLLPKAKTKAPESGTPLGEFLAEELRFYGPVDPAWLQQTLWLPAQLLEETLEELVDAQRIVLDEVSDDASGPQVCDAENLERLLRIMRAGARPTLEPQPVDRLPLFIAQTQGLGKTGASIEDLQQALEHLFALPLSPELWETEVLPARLEPYHTTWLDTLLAETELQWLGAGDKKVCFVFGPDRELLGTESTEADGALDEVFPHPAGQFGFEELLRHSQLGSTELTARLWNCTWQGQVSNTSFAALRTGIDSKFQAVDAPTAASLTGHRGRRMGFERWKASRPFGGGWYRLPSVKGAADALEQEELNRDRVRLLLERWGVLFRELLERELPTFQWSRLFRTLRLMELSGEVVTGQFFLGVPGPQFATPATVRRLTQSPEDECIYWMSAIDPASPCGLGLEGLERLPRRIATNHLVYHGTRLVLLSERKASRLEVRVGPEHAQLPQYLQFLTSSLTRQARPWKSVTVESINGEPAASSPYRKVLETLFEVSRDTTTLRVMRRY